MPEITAGMTAADIEEVLMDILRRHRPGGRSMRGYNNHLEVYAEAVQKELLEPLLLARASAGLIHPIDDLGHETDFAKAWNRALAGAPDRWDCRSLASMLIHAVTDRIGGDPIEIIQDLFAGRMDRHDTAILRELPDLLMGNWPYLATNAPLMGRVTGEYLTLAMKGMQPALKEDTPEGLVDLRPVAEFRHIFNFEVGKEPGEILAITSLTPSFPENPATLDLGEKMFTAWREAVDGAADLVSLERKRWETDMHAMSYSLTSLDEIGILEIHCRQDEAFSLRQTEEGAILYRGSVAGLPSIMDEGRLLIGHRDDFRNLSLAAGLADTEFDAWILGLMKEEKAVAIAYPEGSRSLYTLDQKTLRAAEFRDLEGTSDVAMEEAVPLFAIGTFDLPPMPSFSERRERGGFEVPEPLTVPSP